jgi:hypothetical protein
LFAVLLLFGGQAGATPITGEGPRRSVDDEAAAVLAGRWVCSALLALARGS